MRKIALYIFIFIASILFCGCSCGGGSSTTYYFNIVKTSFVCNVGDNFKVFDEEIKSNLPSYEHMHIYSENTKIAKVLEDKSIDILDEGEVTVIVSGYFNKQSFSDSFTIVANKASFNPDGEGSSGKDEGEGAGDSSQAVYTANKLLDTIDGERIVVYEILKDGASFSDFIIDTSSLDNNIIVNKVYDTIECILLIGESFEITLLDAQSNIILVISIE